jgi:hypothetical protein
LLASGPAVYHELLLRLVDNVPPTLPLPVTIVDLPHLWWVSLVLVAFTWFQPLLLRLNSRRIVAWSAVFGVTPMVWASALPGGFYGFLDLFPWIAGATAGLTASLMLMGQRTRCGMGLIAGLAYVFGVLVAGAFVWRVPAVDFHPLGSLRELTSMIGLMGAGVRALLTIMVGNITFGLPLIFWTRPILSRVSEAP